jgi:hypothetical protein
MPWRGPEHPGEFPTLGYVVADWIERWCRVPDGDHAGEPFVLTDEMLRFLLWHYRLKSAASVGEFATAFHFRRSQLVRPQKWGKGPFSAAMICAEAVGPALFAGWDGLGEPVGRPWPTPLIQITANSEDQTDNVYRALTPMIELGPLADVIPDTGETRINLPGGGRIDPVTSKARSRLGQRVTFVVQDETGLWTPQSGMVALAETQRRGLAGMGGRSVETTNAWDPAENSVAQRTSESLVTDVFRDHRMAPKNLSYRNKVERRRIHRAVYGDSWWVNLDAIEAEAAELLETDPGQAERFFGNRIVAGLNSFLPDGAWAAREVLRAAPTSGPVCLAFDGSDSDDWTSIRAETMDGWQFTPLVGPDARPSVWNPAEFGGRIPRGEVDAAVDELFGRFDVVRMYCDPPDWSTEVENWALQHGEAVVAWPTYRVTQMHAVLERFLTDLSTGRLTHDGCLIAATHLQNARKIAKAGQKYLLGKPTQHQKIDHAMTSTLVHEAVCDALAAGWTDVPQDRRVIVFR